MKQQVRFKRAAADREATQTRRLIADLYRIVAILDADIAVRVSDIRQGDGGVGASIFTYAGETA